MDYWSGLMTDLASENTIVPDSSVVNEVPEVLMVPENNQEEIDLMDFYSYLGYNDAEPAAPKKEEANSGYVKVIENDSYYDYQPQGPSNPHSKANDNIQNDYTDGINPFGLIDDPNSSDEEEGEERLPSYTPPPPPPPSSTVNYDSSKEPAIYPEPVFIPLQDSPKKSLKSQSLQQKMAMLQNDLESENKLKSSSAYYGGGKSVGHADVSLLHPEVTFKAPYESPRERPQKKLNSFSHDVNVWDASLQQKKNMKDKEEVQDNRRVVSIPSLTHDDNNTSSNKSFVSPMSEDSDVEVMPIDKVSSLDATLQGGAPAHYHSSSQLIARGNFGSSAGMKQANKVVFAAQEAINFVKDLAVAQLTTYVSSNLYISSFVGCVNESVYYMADRAKTISDLYIQTITSDDPEKRHLYKIRNSTKWQNILLRYSMASLTWKQRQLLEETRDGGTLDQLDLNRLMKDMTVKKSNERLMRIADEYFYITTAPDNSTTSDAQSPDKQTTVDSLLSNELVVKKKIPHTPAMSENIDDDSVNIVGHAVVPNTVAMDFIQSNIHTWLENEAAYGDDDAQYALARFFSAPRFTEANCCYICSRNFSIILFRHHCRFCGQSVCEEHSNARRCIYRYGLIQPVRVCTRCKVNIDEIHRRDVLIWRESRIQAYLNGRLIPYFNPTVDRGVDKALRIADYSLIAAKNTLILSFPTKVLIETIDILKRYGLSGFTGLLLRKDFLESVETLKRISGMDDMFSLTLHELTACIYYKLAIDRGLRGCNPEGEKIAHAPHMSSSSLYRNNGGAVHTTNSYHGSARSSGGSSTMGSSSHSHSSAKSSEDNKASEDYDCGTAHIDDIEKAIRFAPLALKIVYEINPVDCQRLAKSQGWDTIYTNCEAVLQPEQPVFTLFGSEVDNKHRSSHGRKSARKEAVLAIRGTQSIQDVVTDIRAAPQEFPPPTEDVNAALNGDCVIDNTEQHLRGDRTMSMDDDDDGPNSQGASEKQSQHWEWLNVNHTSTYACGGISRSAMYILKEVGPSLLSLYQEGYDITIVGHSLGGAVAALLTHMLRHAIPNVYCITYGCPSCVDAVTADLLKNFVLNVVNHDDVICRITPHSIRILMSELMLFREQVFKHIQQDWTDVMARAYSLWSPRYRQTHSKQDHLNNNNISSRGSTLKAVTNSSSVGPSKILIGDAATRDSPMYDSEVNSAMVVVEQEELPELWLPGRIIHIYLHKGQYHASEVSRTFPDLRRIEVQGNIFEDHRSKNMLNALLEVRSVMHASSRLSTPPDWVPFNSVTVCYCCQNSFTWHSTFRGDAQEFRDRYNCKHCGNVVCGPCSSNRRAIPKYGLLFSERICDTCIYKGDFALLNKH